jgi:pimeloyl-ACP methyl ester carboxylesterase
MRDVVVCIPGITGSVLRKDGKDVWNISGGALLSALTTLGRNITALKLKEDPHDQDDLGDGITAPEVIRDVHLIPSVWKIDGYTKILRTIEETLDVTRGRNLFEFPYDWRRHNAVAARRLQRRGVEWLEVWRTSSGADDANLVLVGHSMGGLIARYFLECLDGWRYTRTLVTFGTPYRGSLDALDTLVNGKKIKFFDLTDVARSFTAIHQLLPTYPCYVDDGAAPAYVDEAEIPNLDRPKAKAALDFTARSPSTTIGRTPSTSNAATTSRGSSASSSRRSSLPFATGTGSSSCGRLRAATPAETARCRARPRLRSSTSTTRERRSRPSAMRRSRTTTTSCCSSSAC